MSEIPCRHQVNAALHTTPAVVFVHVPEGCACFPEDRYQYLCYQHLWKLDFPYEVLMDRRADYPCYPGGRG